MSYETHLPKTPPSPLQGYWGKRYFTAIGRRMDALVQQFRDAVTAKLPLLAPVDALPYIGVERSLVKGPSETDPQYAARLHDAWDLWGGDQVPITGKGGGGGSHLGMLNAIKATGLPTGATGATIVQQNGRYAQLDGSGNLVLGNLSTCVGRINLLGSIQGRAGWQFEPRDNFHSEFGVLFPANVASLTAGSTDASRLNAAVLKWRPANMLYIGCWVHETNNGFGWPIAQTWGDLSNWGGDVVRYIPSPDGDHTRIGYHFP